VSEEAKAKVKFREISQEAFEAFADEVAEHNDDLLMTYHEKTLLGLPYVLVRVPHGPDGFGFYPLCVEAGDYLCIGETECWVECDNCNEIRNKSNYGNV
jgi:hypothetical protein